MKTTFNDQISTYYLDIMIDDLLNYVYDEKIVSKDNQDKLINKIDDIKRELENIMDNAYRFGYALDSIKLEIDDLE